MTPQTAATFPALVRAAATAYGDDQAVVLKGETTPDQEISFAELDRQSAEIARGLIARGVGKGARIGFIFGNGPNFALALAAIARIGAIAVPISTLIKANELVRVLRQSDVCGLIITRTLLGHDYVERLCDALPDLRTAQTAELRIPAVPYLRWIVSSGSGLPVAIRGMDYLRQAATTVSDDLLREIEAEVHTTDQMLEIYTSGSMALPKGVKCLHGPVLFRTHYMRSMLDMQRGQTVRAGLPMFWVGGFMMYLMPSLECGATTVCTEGTSTNSRAAMGSVLSDEDLEKIRGLKPWWGLGMSETLGPYAYGDDFRDPAHPMCAPMDHFADGYEIRIADENDEWVDYGEIGEMQVRGYPVTPGLHKVEREGYYTPDGYYHTGDMCLRKENRALFVGRSGDMIKTASSNVSPAEVELEMQELDGVLAAYVVGIPDKKCGQLVAAAVVPREGVKLDFGAIERLLRQRMSSFKVPIAYVEMTLEEVPMLHSNKVARRQIETMIIERLGRTVSD